MTVEELILLGSDAAKDRAAIACHPRAYLDGLLGKACIYLHDGAAGHAYDAGVKDRKAAQKANAAQCRHARAATLQQE